MAINVKKVLLASAACATFFGVSSFDAGAQELTSVPSANQDGTATLQTITLDDDVGVTLTVDTDVNFSVAHDITQTDVGLDGPDGGVIELQGTGGAETSLGLTVDAGATVATGINNSGDVLFTSTGTDMNIAGGITINGALNAAGGGNAINLSDSTRDSATTITINGDGGGADGDVTGNVLLGDNAGATDTLILNDDAVITGTVTGGAGDQLLSFTGTGGSSISSTVDLGAGSTGDRILVNLTDADDTATISGAITNVDDVDVQSGVLVIDAVYDNTNADITISDGATLRVGGSGDIQVDITNEAGQTGTQTIEVENGGTLGTAGTIVDLGAGDDAITLDGATVSADSIIGGDGDDTLTVDGNDTTITSDIAGFETLLVASSDTLFIGTGGATEVLDEPDIVLQGNGAGITINTTESVIGDIGVGSGAGGSQQQTITLTAGTYEGDVLLRDGDDTVTISGGVFGATDRSGTLNLGPGNDTLNLDGGILYNAVVGGGGSDNFFVGGDATLANGVTLGLDILIDNSVTLTVDAGSGRVYSNINELNVGQDQGVILNSGHISGDIDLAGGTNTLTITGGRFTGDYTGGGGDDTVTINLGAATDTLSLNEIDFGGGGTDVFNITQGVLTLTDLVSGSADVTMAANNSSLYLTADSTLNAGDFTANTGSTLTFELTDTTDFGNVVATGDAVVTDNTVQMRVTTDNVVEAGDTFDLITSTGGATDFQTTTFTDISVLLDFINTSPDADTLQATAVVADIGDMVAGEDRGYLSPLADELLSVPAGTDDDLDTLRGRLLSAESTARVAEIIESSGPTMDGGALIGTMEAARQANHTVRNQLASLRTKKRSGLAFGNAFEDQYYASGSAAKKKKTSSGTGFDFDAIQRELDRVYEVDSSKPVNERKQKVRQKVAAYDREYRRRYDEDGPRLWAQVYGAGGDQNERQNIPGFSFKTFGFMAGADTKNAAENLTLGLAFSYADTNVDSDTINRTENNIDSYLFTAYGEYMFDNDMFVNAQVSGGMNDIDQTRINVGGTTVEEALSDYTSNQYQIYSEVGRLFSWDNDVHLTPVVSMNYMMVEPTDYTEKGLGGANLIVETDPLSVLELGIGAELSSNFYNNNGMFTPSVRAAYRYDLIDEEVQSTTAFVGGGSSFVLEGFDPAESRFTFGAGMHYLSRGPWQLSADYELDLRADYVSQSGYMKAAYRF